VKIAKTARVTCKKTHHKTGLSIVNVKKMPALHHIDLIDLLEILMQGEIV
jgi:hypothetical protein